MVASILSFSTVKLMSFVPFLPMDCKIISTFTFFCASLEKMRNARPGLSGTPMTEILATFSSFATPLMSIFSTLVASLTIVPLARVRLERTSNSI